MWTDNLTELEVAQFLASNMGEIEQDVVKRTTKLMESAKKRGVAPEKIVELEKKLLKVLMKRIGKFLEVEYGTCETKREEDGSVKVVFHPSKKGLEKQEESKRIREEYLEKLKSSSDYYLEEIKKYTEKQNQTETLGK